MDTDGFLGIMRDGELVDEFILVSGMQSVADVSEYYGTEYTVDIGDLAIHGCEGHEWRAFLVRELGISYDERPGTNELIETTD